MTYSLFSSLFARGFVGALWPAYWASESPGRLGSLGSALTVRHHMPKASGQTRKTRRLAVPQPASRGGSGAGGAKRQADAAAQSKGSAELLAFARGLRELAAEAEQLHGDAVEERLKAITTRNLETRFRNSMAELANGLRERQETFSRLVNEHGTDGDSLCSRVLCDLEKEGFTEYLGVISRLVDRLAVRARGGISKSDRENMLTEIRAVTQVLAGLNEIAEEIERRVKAIRNDRSQGNQSRSSLPQSVEEALLGAESAARAFIAKLASRSIDFEKHPTESTLGWLRAAEAERKRLMDAADAFAAVLAKFTDEHLEKAERAEHTEARKLVEEILRVVASVRARRNLGQQLIQSVIQSLQATLSLDDDALESAGRLQYMLKELENQLMENGVSVSRQQDRAERHLRLQRPPKKPLPEWTALDREGRDELKLLVTAFVRLLDEQPKGVFTKVRLEGQLQTLRPRGKGWSSWLDRRLKKAAGLGIVIPSKPDRNRRVPHTFGLSAVALRKYAAAARAFR